MAYYDALRTVWNSSTQPPAGVIGTALSSGMTTSQKIAAINGWKVASPLSCILPTYAIYNSIVPTEFVAVSSASQQLLRDILGLGTVDASPGTSIRTRIVSIFPSSTQTFTNLAALVAPFDNNVQVWCATKGYPVTNGSGNLSLPDATNAGLV